MPDEPSTDFDALTAALLREPEVGPVHAEMPDDAATDPGEPTAEATEPSRPGEPPVATADPAEPTADPAESGVPPIQWGEPPRDPPVVPPVASPGDGPVLGAPRRRRAPGARRVAVAAVLIVATIATGATFLDRSASAAASPSPTPADVAAAPSMTAADQAASPSAVPSPEPTATEEPTEVPVALDGGHVVFSDDFHDASKGWPTAATTLTSFRLAGGYNITAKGAQVDHLVEAPFEPRVAQIVVTAQATLAAGKGTAGLGVTCGSKTTPIAAATDDPPPSTAAGGSREILYEFIVRNSGTWLVARRDGPPSASVQPIVLMAGTTTAVPGARPMTITGICATAPDGTRTRLILAIDGFTMIDFSDADAVVTAGWHGGLVVSTVSGTAGAQFRHFDVRDLAAAS